MHASMFMEYDSTVHTYIQTDRQTEMQTNYTYIVQCNIMLKFDECCIIIHHHLKFLTTAVCFPMHTVE